MRPGQGKHLHGSRRLGVEGMGYQFQHVVMGETRVAEAPARGDVSAAGLVTSRLAREATWPFRFGTHSVCGRYVGAVLFLCGYLGIPFDRVSETLLQVRVPRANGQHLVGNLIHEGLFAQL